MSPRWRWAIVAGVALALAALLDFRLDTGRMQKTLPPLVAALTGATVHFDRLSFSMVHGLDVRLDRVRMQHASWSVTAPTALLELRVVPLLLGKIELSGIYLRSPVIRLAPRQPTKTRSVMEAHGLPREMMLDQFSVSDATLMSTSGQTWISGLDMDIHDIGPSRTMRWELQARAGEQSAVGHGQLSLRLGTIDSGFGKLTLERIPLQALGTLVRLPDDLTPRLIRHGYDRLSAVLTLNIGHNDQWTLFGDTKVTGAADRPEIMLRGRAYRDATHALGWKDTFLQIGADARVGAEGSCTAAGICTSAIRGSAVNLATLFSLSAPTHPAWQPVSGSMDMQGNLRWQRQGWTLAGQAEMQAPAWRDAGGKFVLPDLHVSDVLLASAQDRAVTLKSARIGFAGQSGILLASGRYHAQTHSGHLLLRLKALQGAWAPVLRLASMVNPAHGLAIAGSGTMQGEVKLSVADGRPGLHFSLDGTQAAIQVLGASKPAGMAAVASGDWQPGRERARLHITSATLGDAVLKGLTWQRRKAKRQLLINRIQLDMQALRRRGVTFPAAMRGFQGAITGYVSTAWAWPVAADQPQGLWPGMAKLNADLDLDRYGTPGWQLSGHLAFDHGHAALTRLMLTGAHGKAQLDGDISFAERRGKIDIGQGALAWNSRDALPAWLDAMRLRGRIKGLDADWLGQSWTGLTGWYQLQAGGLRLTNVRAGIADGRLTSHDIRVGFIPGGMTLKGRAQLGAVHVQRLRGLDGPLSGHLTGKAFATIKFDGSLPLPNWQGWRSDGNVVIYGGGWRPQPKGGKVQAIHRFARLGFRFRNRHGRAAISHIQYEDAGGRYTGSARLGSKGAVRGRLVHRKDAAAFTLGGVWPYLDLKPALPPAH